VRDTTRDSCTERLRGHSRDHGDRLLPLGRPASGQASIEASCQAPIRSRSAVSGRRRRHNAGKSALGRHAGIESAAAARVCAAHRTPPHAEDDSECRNVPPRLTANGSSPSGSETLSPSTGRGLCAARQTNRAGLTSIRLVWYSRARALHKGARVEDRPRQERVTPVCVWIDRRSGRVFVFVDETTE
jgi:hypothetical protein